MGTMVAMAHVAMQSWLPGEHGHRSQPRLLNWQGPPSRCSDAMCAAAALSASFRPSRRQTLLCRAASEVEGPDFDLSQYVEGKVFEIKHTDQFGHIVLIKVADGEFAGNLLPIYVGDPESDALRKGLQHQSLARPMTHDFLKSSLESLGFRVHTLYLARHCKNSLLGAVTKVRVHLLVGNTYHARVHFAPSPAMRAAGATAAEVDVDARPSDAINLAVRFKAPLYISKEVAHRMSKPLQELALRPESAVDIRRTCKEDLDHYPDATLHLQLQLQLAIANDDFERAALLRSEIDKLLGSDRILCLVVAIETALADERYEEAARLRDELRSVRAERLQSAQAETQEA